MPTHHHPTPHTVIKDAVAVSLQCFSVTPWHPSSCPPHLPGLRFYHRGRPVLLSSTPGYCASVHHLPRHSATVPIGPGLLHYSACSLFLILFISLLPLLFSPPTPISALSFSLPPPHLSPVANPVAIPVMRHYYPFSSETAVS